MLNIKILKIKIVHFDTSKRRIINQNKDLNIELRRVVLWKRYKTRGLTYMLKY